MAKLVRNEPVVFHFRVGSKNIMEPKAGATVVFLPDKKVFGVALCCDKDRYSRCCGRKIATHRAENHHNVRGRRFPRSLSYEGDNEFDDVRRRAAEIVKSAAKNVGNPVEFWE